MKKLGTMLLFGAIALTVGTLEAAWGNAKSDHSQNILFIQTAREAVIERDPGEAQGTYTLVLKGVQPNLAYFGDQPKRLAGKLALNQFVNDWSKGKGIMTVVGANGALNGALVTTSTTPSNITDVSESLILLSEPVYDIRAQELKFKIRNMSSTHLEVGRHANPILFIDNN